MSDDPVPWDRLSPSARQVVMWQIRTLASGFTGEIRLRCNQGGVRHVNVDKCFEPQDLVDDLAA